MNFVIGSGPAGVMAAKGLLDMGQSVTMLDIGAVLDSERAQTADNLARQDPSRWDLAHVSRITNPLGSPELKRHFGSNYPYALGVQSGLEEHGTRCLVSQARGGLSTVWGAAVLPTPHSEMGAWPFPATTLDPHYEAAGGVLSIAAVRGELEDVFPFYGEPRPAARPTAQANQLLSHFRKTSQVLTDAGVRFGPSRLAMEAGSCRDCALCLSGCPYGVIWSSVGLLKELQKNPQFTYRPSVRVLSVESSSGMVTIQALGVLDQKPVVFSGQKVFLACGPLATARIVLTSLKAYEQPFTLAFQPYFLLPAMMHSLTPAAATERAMTLAQIFLEICDPAISPNLVHLQVYTRNEFITDRVRRLARWAGPWSGSVERQLLGRLIAIQGYLHSSAAEPVKVTAKRVGDETRLILRAPTQNNMKRVMTAVKMKLKKLSPDLGFSALTPLMKIGFPGEGNHVGGIFPMRRSPSAFETNVLGELPGLQGVHLVDSSVLPELSATTFTYTIMANAHRIATQAVSA